MALHSNKVKAKIIKSSFTCQRDNLTIRGTEYRPKGDCLPIAIVSHGFMAFQDTVRQYAKAMAEMGYVSYCFDFCGGCVIKGKSDGSTTEMSVLTEVKDLEAVGLQQNIGETTQIKGFRHIQSDRTSLLFCGKRKECYKCCEMLFVHYDNLFDL